LYYVEYVGPKPNALFSFFVKLLSLRCVPLLDLKPTIRQPLENFGVVFACDDNVRFVFVLVGQKPC
jgi:hypothetical protein